MSNDTNVEYQSCSEYKAGIIIWKTVPPVLITFGTCGNILSIVVLTRKSIRKSTTAMFLIFLTFSDLCVLYTGLLRQWLIYLIDFDIRHFSEAFCKIHIWLVYSSLDFSAWILISVTLERIIAVWCPYSYNSKCSRRTAISCIMTILLLVLGLNSHLLYGMVDKDSGITEQACSSIDENYSNFFRSAWSWIDLCMFSLIPFVVIVFGNSLILLKLFQRSRTSNQPNRNRRHHYDHHQSSMTTMLCTLNTVFLITTLPISIYNIGYTYWYSTQDQRTIAYLELWWSVVNMLMYTNNALNFLLYSLSGSRFRKELKRLVCRMHNAADTAFIPLKPMTHATTAKDIPLNRNCTIGHTPDIKQNQTIDTVVFGSRNTVSSSTAITLPVLSSSSSAHKCASDSSNDGSAFVKMTTAVKSDAALPYAGVKLEVQCKLPQSDEKANVCSDMRDKHNVFDNGTKHHSEEAK